ncbi:uncharacterized protein LOC134436996 isoform X2 [Engraulis encrasicolus]|uniref:uncharacterized protein LOC134436996 isoform X2 n=1 Tax=Engraulis encrasicolus TaxID=184585 RepID=UPI002FD29BAF
MDFHIVLMFLWTLCGVPLNALKFSLLKPAVPKRLLEGDSWIISLNSPKQDGDTLVWECDNDVIYERRNGTVKGFADVDDRGTLTLKNVTTAMSCTYSAEHRSIEGELLKTQSKEISVVPKVLVPTLAVVCSSSGEGTLHCVPGGTKGFSTLSWFHNNRVMNETINPFMPTLHRTKDQYRCRLTNDQLKEDVEDSNDVTISCPKSADVCQLPKEEGTCVKFFLQWYYDSLTKSCSLFWYGGCAGNGNRFETKEECETTCGKADRVSVK